MADRETSFISRWSRRKRDPGKEPGKENEPAAGTAELAGQAAAVTAPSGDPADPGEDDAAGDPEVVAKLPDIESLDETSDFSPFMAKGVPEILRRRALRKLWRLDPLFANLDGLNDYDEDFTDAANLLTEIKTIYKVGKGMVSKEAPEKTPGETPGETPEETPEETPGETPEETVRVEGSREQEPTGPQLAQSAAKSPEISQTTSAGPDDVAEPAALPEDDVEAVRGGSPRAGMPRRSAAARRWGDSSE